MDQPKTLENPKEENHCCKLSLVYSPFF